MEFDPGELTRTHVIFLLFYFDRQCRGYHTFYLSFVVNLESEMSGRPSLSESASDMKLPKFVLAKVANVKCPQVI